MKRLILTVLAVLAAFTTLSAQSARDIAENLKADIGMFGTAETVQDSDDLFIANLNAEGATLEHGIERISGTLASYVDISIIEPWSESYDYALPAMTITLLAGNAACGYVYVVGISLVESDGLWMTMLVARGDKQSLGIEE